MTLISDLHITNTKKERTALNRADWFFIRQDLIAILEGSSGQSYVINGDVDTIANVNNNNYADEFGLVIDMGHVGVSIGKFLINVTDATPNIDFRVLEDGVEKGEELGVSATGIAEVQVSGLSLTGNKTIILQARRSSGGGTARFDLVSFHHGNPALT